MSLDFISERRRNRNSINSIDGFYNNSINNLLIDEKGDKFLVYEHETQINDKEYANNFNLAFRSDNKQLFDNEDVNDYQRCSKIHFSFHSVYQWEESIYTLSFF